ncbi:MAG: FxsA family protein [Gemmatimonadota bacterium]
MSILSRLALLFVGVPLLELFILIQLGQVMGLWPTIGLVILTGLAGAALARLEGLRTLWRIQGELARGQLPGSALLDGLAILLGGALLLTPGILTDLVGFSFLLPPTRKFLLGRIRKSMERSIRAGSIQVMHFGGFGFGAGSWSAPGEGEHPMDSSGGGEIVLEPGGDAKDDSVEDHPSRESGE